MSSLQSSAKRAAAAALFAHQSAVHCAGGFPLLYQFPPQSVTCTCTFFIWLGHIGGSFWRWQWYPGQLVPWTALTLSNFVSSSSPHLGVCMSCVKHCTLKPRRSERPVGVLGACFPLVVFECGLGWSPALGSSSSQARSLARCCLFTKSPQQNRGRGNALHSMGSF